MNLKNLITVFVCLAFLNLGSIRPKDDPILRTQTNPISLKAKTEELKDGPKGAPAPAMKFYANREFLVEPAVENVKEEASLSPESKIPKPGKPIPEDLEGEAENAGFDEKMSVKNPALLEEEETADKDAGTGEAVSKKADDEYGVEDLEPDAVSTEDKPAQEDGSSWWDDDGSDSETADDGY